MTNAQGNEVIHGVVGPKNVKRERHDWRELFTLVNAEYSCIYWVTKSGRSP